MFVRLTFCLTVKLLQMPTVNFLPREAGEGEGGKLEWVVYYTMFACALEGSAGFGLKVRPTAARKTDKSKNILRPLCVGFKFRRKKQLYALSSANSRVGVGEGHEGLCMCACVCWPFCKSACNYPNRSLQVY